MPDIAAIIPARSGSKGIPDKNIRLLNGKPLIAYSIEHALASKLVNRVIVSTDSEAYAKISRQYGAETPFLRPGELARDESLDIDLFYHALRYFAETEKYFPEICVHLRPTHPVRRPEDIDAMIKILLGNPSLDSVRSISQSKTTPYKMWRMDNTGLLEPVATCQIPEAYNAPRQLLPVTYTQNACIDVVRSRVILEERSMTGKRINGFIQDMDFDIDTEAEFLRAEHYLEIKDKIERNLSLTVCFDIDGIIAGKTPANDYSVALPIESSIKLVNNLYELGHHVILFTARGSATGIDWEKTTRAQLEAWGVKFSGLKFGKPAADIYVDDRFVEIDKLLWYIKGVK